jgi:tetratricopeptide (TPR) repeat protein
MRQTQEIVNGVAHTRYVHAANNLGWLQMEEGEYSEAIATFDTTETECLPPSTLRACAYIWYNRGDAEASLHDYVAAEEQFERAIERITGRNLDDTDSMLEAQAQQNRAFALVRQAALAVNPEKDELLDRAEGAWRAGAAIYEAPNLDMPEHHHITFARIHIERGEWQQAIELLTSLDVQDRRISVESLLAGAYACIGDVDNQFSSVGAMIAARDVQTPIDEGFSEIARIEENCE